jgi:hypothetical protein
MRCASETKTEQAAIETRGTAGCDDFEALLVVPVQQLVGDRAGRSFICQLRRFGTVPLDADNSDRLVRQNASHGRGGLKGFEPRHLLCLAVLFAETTRATCLRG